MMCAKLQKYLKVRLCQYSDIDLDVINFMIVILCINVISFSFFYNMCDNDHNDVQYDIIL